MLDHATLERFIKLCRRSVLPSALILVGVTLAYSYLALKAPRIADPMLYTLFPLSFFVLATASCGWLFLACVRVLRRGEVTLEDEYGEATTNRGKGATAWAVAGIILAVLLYLLGVAIPVGIVLEWLGLL